MNDIAIGIDIGGTTVTIGIVNNEGAILKEVCSATVDFDAPVTLVESVLGFFNSFTTEYGTEDFCLKGIGIGAPNGNSLNGYIENAHNLSWKGRIPLAEMFEKKIGLPVFLTNDANAAALGEMYFGGAKEMKDFILITIGTGLGSGFVSNGNLVVGHDGHAGELGHIKTENNNRVCGCGLTGCLETFISSKGIIETFKKMKPDDNNEPFISAGTPDITPESIYKAAVRGDEAAINTFRVTGEILGAKLADIVAITSPQAIFFFGGVSNAFDLFAGHAKKAMEENLLPVFRNKVALLKSELINRNAAVLGSAAYILKKYS